MKRISIFVLAAVLLTAFSCKPKEKVTVVSGAKKTASANHSQSQNQTATATVNDKVIEFSKEDEVTRQESFKLSDGDESLMAKKYHVVVGSFSNQNNAKGLQATLKSEGFNPLIVINERGMYRVLLASFNEYSQARAQINAVKSRFPDAWVLVQNK